MDSSDKTPEEGAGAPLSDSGPHRPPANLDYEIVRLIGKGGYGEVWLVRDKEGEYRACKVVYRESFYHDRPYEREYEGICRFEPVSRASESQVKILYVGRRDAAGYFFYIMELADAAGGAAIQPETYVPRTLNSELARRGRLPVDECIRIGVSLSAALDNLHQHRLIHRDVKPANVIFVKGIPKLADIGLVTEADVTVSYVGTGGFIPPEGPGTEQADVYGLGKTLYEISTGMDRLEYPELPVNFGDLPDRAALLEFNAVVAQACEANVRKRYASASALHADLAVLQSGKSIRQIRSSKRRWKLGAQVAVAATLGLLVALAGIHFRRIQMQPAEARLAESPALQAQTSLPAGALVAQSEAKIRETYRAQLAGGTSAAKQQAAFELVEKSGMAEDPATQLASLRVASLLAIKAGNFSLAMQICDKTGAHFHIDSLPAKTELLSQAGDVAGKKADLAGCCLQTGFEAIADDDYDDGMKLAAQAKVAAQYSGDERLVKEAEFLGKEMARCKDGFERITRSENILRVQPGDPGASVDVGKFLCFVKNDWETGVPLMERTSNEVLKSALAGETNKEPTTSDEDVALGNLWRQLAGSADDEGKAHYQQRARYWYLKAVTAAKEPEKTRFQRQLAEWIQATPTEPGEIHILTRHDGDQTIDVYSDEIRWKSGRGAFITKINQAPLGDLKAGDLKIIKNTGATRYLPNAVDFSTARLAVVRKARKQERAKLECAPDHVRIILSHPRSGFAETEVTIAFGNQP